LKVSLTDLGEGWPAELDDFYHYAQIKKAGESLLLILLVIPCTSNCE